MKSALQILFWVHRSAFFAYLTQLLSFVSFIYQAKWLTFKFEHMYPIKRLELVELQKK